MSNFIFFKYQFEKTGEKSLFSEDSNEALSNEFFNNKLRDRLITNYGTTHKSLNLYSTKEDGPAKLYSNDIKRIEDGIVLLSVRNNKHKKIMPIDKNEAMDVGHYPYCWVVIDTRPYSQAILVQQKKDTFQNSDLVANVIADYCSRELSLSLLDWKININKRLCKGTIWDIVKARTANNQDRVKSLSIKIENRRADENCEVDAALQMILEKLAAPEGELRLLSNDAARRLLDETKEDVRKTVDMLIENKYRMKIGFDKSGSVEFGRDAEAVYGVADNVCAAFENGEGRLGTDGKAVYDFVSWLNTLIPEDEEHIYTISHNKKRNGRGRKK